MRIFRVAMLCGLALAAFNHSAVSAEVLITSDEARLPPSGSTVLPTRGLTRGPGIEQESPSFNQTVRSPLPFKIKFHVRNNVSIDPASVRLTYVKATPVDLTGRIRSHIRPDGIIMEQAEVPPGVHVLRLDITDMQGRFGTAMIRLNVSDR
jgi:hypothetical protein